MFIIWPRQNWEGHGAVVRKSHIFQAKKQEGHGYCPGIIIWNTAISIFKYCGFFVFHYTDFQGLKNELSNSYFKPKDWQILVGHNANASLPPTLLKTDKH